jgi:hypothetical protein
VGSRRCRMPRSAVRARASQVGESNAMRVRMRERLENPERPDKRLDGQQETMLTFVSPGFSPI